MANTETALQEFLDSLSQAPGSLLYRHQNEWRALAPGNEGEALSLDANLYPSWRNFGAYKPAWMTFNGSSTYYRKYPITTTGSNAFTVVASFQTTPQAQNGAIVYNYRTTTPNHAAFYLAVVGTSDATNAGKLRLILRNSANTDLCYLHSIDRVDDDTPYQLFADYDATTGQARLLLNLADVDDTAHPSRVLTTGTVSKGSSSNIGVASSYAASSMFTGKLRHLGFSHIAGLDPTDFHTASGKPVRIEDDVNAAWGGVAPLLWQESAKCDQATGSLGAFNEQGLPLLFNEAA